MKGETGKWFSEKSNNNCPIQAKENTTFLTSFGKRMDQLNL